VMCVSIYAVRRGEAGLSIEEACLSFLPKKRI
jgi:hypothetical protein